MEIIYEDQDIVAVNKEAGVLVHDDGSGALDTVAEWFRTKYPESGAVGEPAVLRDGRKIDRPGVVHRLDRDTSGVLVLAKTQTAHAFLKRQFQTHAVRKVYHALVYGTMRGDGGVINKPIGRSTKDFRQWSAEGHPRGTLREALTAYSVVERFPKYTMVEFRPETGRTHQLRVHSKAIGHPIVCDPLYAKRRACLKECARQMLHASSIELTLPSGLVTRIEAAIRDDFASALEALRNTC